MTESVPSDENVFAQLSDVTNENAEITNVLTLNVFEKNRANAYRFLKTPYSKRLVLAPQCLRSTANCSADEQRGEYLCNHCGACKIPIIANRAEKLGYLGMKILKGGSIVHRILKELKPEAVLAVCCSIEGIVGILSCEQFGIPAFCVPLLTTGCADTDVDLKDVWGPLEGLLL
jgi:uncharacterized protein